MYHLFSFRNKKMTTQPDEYTEKIKNKYKQIINGVPVDVYDLLDNKNINNPAYAHAFKKLLKLGNRGHKTLEQDIKDVIVSIERGLELNHIETIISEEDIFKAYNINDNTIKKLIKGIINNDTELLTQTIKELQVNE